MLNEGKPESPNYSVLGKWNENWKNADGKFLLKLVFPELTKGKNSNTWKQTSNPIANMKLNKAGVDGYEAIEIHHTT